MCIPLFIPFVVTGPAQKERADDFVGVEYIMERTGLKRRTILEGKAGTSAITRVSIRPARWQRASVDAFCKRRAEQQKRGNFPRLVKRNKKAA